MIGALAGGRIVDRVGRRPTVLGTAALFVAGVILAAFSPSYGVLVGARVIIGLAVGSASMVVPLYIGEVVPPRVRAPHPTHSAPRNLARPSGGSEWLASTMCSWGGRCSSKNLTDACTVSDVISW